jgi:FMN phosphatase YigB (HAD superfamily)/DNA-binding XRE family transcriptional regulator
MAMDEKGLGRRLQAARVAAGFTQQALCQQAGLSYSTLTKIERGAIKAPSIFTIQSIAAALGIDLGDLLGQPTVPTAPKQTSKSGVRFVYFDVNGCLVRFFHHAFTRLAEESGAPADLIETSFWHYNDAVCRGEMSVAAFDKALAHDLQLPSVDWRSYYLEAIEPISAMHELLSWVSEHYYVGLLTNIMPGFLATMRQQGIVPNIAYDAIIDSSEVQAIKPEKAIYTIATERSHCKGSEILFIDDSRTNLMAAERQGWHVLWFDDYRPEESVGHVRKALEFFA